jgi:HEPN domain-containing protein
VDLPEDFVAARGYLSVARGDLAKGFFWSACLTAQKAGEVALQSYIRSRGMSALGEGMPVLLAELPSRTAALEGAAALLERFRMDMHSPYRSFAGPDPDPTPEAASNCCRAAESLVDHVESLFAAAGPQGGAGASGEPAACGPAPGPRDESGRPG